MLTRLDCQKLVNYYEQVFDKKDYSKPDPDTVRAISRACTESAQKAHKTWLTKFSSSPEKKTWTEQLNKAPRLCGHFGGNPLLSGGTPMEQMEIVSEWVENAKPSKRHTFSLKQQGAEGDSTFIPVTIAPPRRGGKPATTAYNVMLGATTGSHKAPVYSEWAETNPAGTEQAIFIDSLNGLETVRAGGDAALDMKAPFFQSGLIDERERYAPVNLQGEPEPKASVELPQQRKKKTVKARHELAPGSNLTHWIEKERLRKANLVPEIWFEEYASDEDGYNDDGARSVTPLDLVKGLGSIGKNLDSSKLDKDMSTLHAIQHGKSTIKNVRDLTVQNLFRES